MFRWFERRLDAFPDVPPATPPAGMIAFIWHYLKPGWHLLAIAGVLSAAIAVAEVSIFAYMGSLVDWLASENREGFFERHGVSVWLMVITIAIVVPAIHVVWELVFHQSFAGNFPMSIRWRAHRYLLNQSLSFFQDDMAGRISATMMQTALAVREAVTKCADVLVYFSVYVLSALALFAGADWRLAIPLLMWVGTYTATLWYFIPRLGDISEAQADARALMTGRVVDSYTNIATVKLFAHSRAEAAYARASMEPFLATVYSQMRVVTVMNGLLHLQNFMLLGALAGLSVLLWHASLVTVGAIAVAIGVVMRLQGLSQWILWEMAALFEALGTIKDGAKLLSRPLTVTDRPGALTLAFKAGEVRFDDVHFGYGRPKGALNGLTLAIRPGEKVGIVGRSGAGKSTLVALMLRLHDIERGRVTIDGHDVSAVTQESLRAAIGVVTQDTALLHRSVAENIRYGNPDATEADVRRAAEAAHAHDFIQDLEDAKGRKAYDAHVGERGVKLSGGQRQRIAIARVFLKNAPILVLDEATSALDSEIEAAIQESLGLLSEGKTVIAIAHRLSTIAAMDRLIVLDRGRVVEEGTHGELIAKGGIYADLWARQSGGFLGVDDADRDHRDAAAE
jgi:ATP-binding cassette, subfamily B, multidrug efflux pump